MELDGKGFLNLLITNFNSKSKSSNWQIQYIKLWIQTNPNKENSGSKDTGK